MGRLMPEFIRCGFCGPILEDQTGQNQPGPIVDGWAGEQIIKPISRPRGRVEQ
jgi:hypothetical protein